MSYQDNSNKIVVVVNRMIVFSRLSNAIAHCCAGLSQTIGNAGDFLLYECPSDGWCAAISRWPVIVLAGKNSGQLARFAREVGEEGLPFNCFTAAMIGDSAEQQMLQTREDQSPQYWVVAAFGVDTELRALTKRFSLFKDVAAPGKRDEAQP